MFRLVCIAILLSVLLSCGKDRGKPPVNGQLTQEQVDKINRINKKVAEGMKQAIGEGLPSAVYEKYKSKPFVNINLVEPVRGRVYGKKNAKNKIIVLSDFACGHCVTASKNLKARVDENINDVNLTYVFYPLDGVCNPVSKGKLSDYSCFSTKLALCTEKQGKVRKAMDFLYGNQQLGNKKPLDQKAFINKMEKELKLAKLSECLGSTWLEHRLKIENDVYKGMNIPGTPYILLNNKELGSVYKFKDSFREFMKYVNLKKDSNSK